MSRMQWAQPCSAHRRDGMPCGAYAIRGGTVCRMHGGAAPQVRAAASGRMLELRLERRAARFDALTPQQQDELVRMLLPVDPEIEHLDTGVGGVGGAHRGKGRGGAPMGSLPHTIAGDPAGILRGRW
jgi:hypothetical protein